MFSSKHRSISPVNSTRRHVLEPIRAGLIACACISLAVAGCQKTTTPAENVATGDEAPIVDVEVATAKVESLFEYREYTGRTMAVDSVDVRARVSGYLKQSPRSGVAEDGSRLPAISDDRKDPNGATTVTVNEGDFVTKDTLLFEIDPRPYQLAFEQTKGSLTAAEARLKQSDQDLKRAAELLQKNALSQAEYDQAIAVNSEIAGQIANLKAAVELAQLDLEFTQVESPICGLLGQTLVTVGNLVTADTTILTTVVSINPIYADFNVDEQSLLDYRKRIREGSVRSAREAPIPIRLGLSNEEGFPHEGFIDFVNNRTDPNSGNTRIRGTFNNDEGKLSPGLFARIQVPFTAKQKVVLVPTIALAMDQQGRYVMVVKDDQVERRPVTPGAIHADSIVIREGINENESVVTSGLQKIRPGSKVQFPPQDSTDESSESRDKSSTNESPSDSGSQGDTDGKGIAIP